MADDSYQQEIARMRQQRKQAEAADQYEQYRQQYNNALENRENAALQMVNNDDPSEWNYWDSEMEEAERNLAPYFQQQAAQPHPAATTWDYKHRQYRDALERKLGPQGAQNIYAAADAYATRPRTGDNNPDRTGMGLRRNSPEYFRAMDNLLETYSGDVTGIPYDSKDTIPTWKEVARDVCGLSDEEYVANYHRAKAAGKIGTGS